MTRDEVLELLPLYAGDDLEPALRLEVERALADDPSLREALAPFEQVDALLLAALGEQTALSAEVARELLPLHAGGDLAPAQQARVDAALDEHPELRAELEPFETLDRMLGAAFADEASDELPALRVRVQCPFCHDALASAPRVHCAECSTPHHAACFAQNAGCSLLGCEGTRSLAADQPALRVCGECEQQTPADAPYCAYCGQALPGADAAPRSSRLAPRALDAKADDPAPPPLRVLPRPGDAWRFVAAAALLLVSGISVGGMFGLQQRTFLQALAAEAAPPTLEAAERELPVLLRDVAEANARFAQEDLEQDGRLDFAADFPELWRALRESIPRDELAQRYPALVRGLGSAWYEIQLAASPAQPESRWCAVASLRSPMPPLADASVFFVNHDARVIELPRQQLDIDPDSCELRVDVHVERVRREVEAFCERLPSQPRVDLGEHVIRVHLTREADLARVHAALPEPLLVRVQQAGLGLAFRWGSNQRAFFGEDMLRLRNPEPAPAGIGR